jgi:hypothetical protein
MKTDAYLLGPRMVMVFMRIGYLGPYRRLSRQLVANPVKLAPDRATSVGRHTDGSQPATCLDFRLHK